MKRIHIKMARWTISLAFLFGVSFWTSVSAQKLIEVGKGYAETSVNTTIFRSNSVVTKGDTQFVAYYDAEGYLTLAKRQLSSENWSVQRTSYKGRVQDAHNVISLMVDGDGFLHIAFDHHNNLLNYCRSVAPYSLTLGKKEQMTGIDEDNVSYPEFYSLKNGNLLFAYRSGASGRGNLVLNQYDLKSAKWERLQDVLIDGEEQRNAYWQLCVDVQGTIHLSWVWRETPDVETNHDLCYARSKDDGITWEKSTGERYSLPITAANAEYAWRIPQNSELINQTSMTADAQGIPYIATYWRDAKSIVPQYRLVWLSDKGWKSTQVGKRKEPFTLRGSGTKLIPIARPQLVVRQKEQSVEAYYIFRDIERDSKVSVAHSADINKGKWDTTDLTDFSVNAWEPSFDTELWKDQGLLHIFVQQTAQGDGEKSVKEDPQPVYIMEMEQPDLPEVRAIKEMITRANGYWQSHNKPQTSTLWHYSAYHTGNMEAYAMMKDPAYLKYSTDWAEHNEWKGAKETDRSKWRYSYGESDEYVLFGDNQICFQTYSDLYKIAPDYKKIARAQEVMEHQMCTNRNDYWWWCDGLYMVMPVMTKLYTITGNNIYLEKLYEYLSYSESIMFDKEAGLFYRDTKYLYPKHKSANGKRDFWARGDGWVMAGLAKVLQDLPASDAHRDHYVSLYKQMAKAVAECQQPEGYWTRSMLDAAHAPGAETSGTAFFTYSLLWGINHGLLDKATYAPVVDRAWNYLATVALQSDGLVGYVQPIGERAIPGQVVDAKSTSNFGVGAFLLAACERIRYIQKW